MKPLKMSIGIRPERPMFRFLTIGGALIDEILTYTEKSKNSKLFKEVEQGGDKSHFRLKGDNCSLFVSTHDVQYSVDHYDSETAMVFEAEVGQFISLFSTLNSSLKMRGIRRIGMVCEYRFPSKTELPSKELLEGLTKFKPAGYPAKFQLQFEQRHPISNAIGVPDFRTDDFWNIIESFYDAEADLDHSAEKQINLMLDVQRYYSPLREDKLDTEIRALVDKYKKQFFIFSEKAKSLGVVDGR
jgi:hypothetical protein